MGGGESASGVSSELKVLKCMKRTLSPRSLFVGVRPTPVTDVDARGGKPVNLPELEEMQQHQAGQAPPANFYFNGVPICRPR